MQKIINDLGKIINDCLIKLKELEGLIALNVTLKEDLKVKKAEMLSKKKDLDARENKIKNVEEIKNRLDALHNLEHENAKDMKELLIKQKAFEASENRVAKEQSDRATDLNNREDVIANRENICTEHEKEIDDIINIKIKKILKG